MYSAVSVGPSQLRVSKSLRTQSCAAQLTVSSQRRSQSVPVPIRPPSIVTLLTSGAKSKSEARFTSQAQSSSAMTTITCALWRPRTAQLREPWSTSARFTVQRGAHQCLPQHRQRFLSVSWSHHTHRNILVWISQHTRYASTGCRQNRLSGWAAQRVKSRRIVAIMQVHLRWITIEAPAESREENTWPPSLRTGTAPRSSASGWRWEVPCMPIPTGPLRAVQVHGLSPQGPDKMETA